MAILALALPIGIRADALSGIGKFGFLNPGVTATGDGPGFELSAGRNGLEPDGALLLGALARYEPETKRAEIGVEFGAFMRP